jgi:hypothetical protein
LILWTLVHFFNSFFCIATCSFSHTKYFLEITTKTLEHLLDGNLTEIFFVFPPSVRVKHFWWNKMVWVVVGVVWSWF